MDRRRVDGGGVDQTASRNAAGIVPLCDSRSADIALISSRRPEIESRDTPRKSAGGVALVHGSVLPVDVGGAVVDADDAASGGHKRCCCRTADVA